ncbi:hypothetical protein Tco_0508609 [Tanacetum coccineum]
MSTLTFADTHNMVAFLEKPAESDGFHEIIDFLNSNQIYYALTINPIIYTSCIEQFWATAKANTVNGERQLQALVDKKRVIITKSSIRSDLHLADAGGIDCLSTATIFEELSRMGSTMVSAIIYLATNQKFAWQSYAEMFDIDDLHYDEVIVDMAVGEKQEKSAKNNEREVSTSVEDSAAPTIPVTTAATATTTRPKVRWVVVQEPSEFRTTTSSPQASQPSKTKDKGKAIMIELEVPLKRKYQIALDEEMARNLEAQLQAELIEK